MTPTLTLVDRLRNCYSGAVYDVLRTKGYVQQTLPHYIRPLNLQHKLAGPIFTIEGKRNDSLDAHQSLLRWCELLSKAPENTVLVCQPHDHTLAHMGELSSETLVYKKVVGYIVDGGCRDSAFIEALGFPVFCRYFTPVDVVGKWAATAFGEPIQIGEVPVRTGDYALADRDGIVIIPAAIKCRCRPTLILPQLPDASYLDFISCSGRCCSHVPALLPTRRPSFLRRAPRPPSRARRLLTEFRQIHRS